MSYEGRLSSTLRVIAWLKDSGIDPTSLDYELINKIQNGLASIKSACMLDMGNQGKPGQLLLGNISSDTLMIWHGRACKGLEVFNEWLKPRPLQDLRVEEFPAPVAHNNHYYPPQPKPLHKTITKTKLSNILHGKEGHKGYHTKFWFYYYFGCIFGLSDKRNATIIALPALLDNDNQSFEENDIKDAIKSSSYKDRHALRRLSLLEGKGYKYDSSTDDIIIELKTAFN